MKNGLWRAAYGIKQYDCNVITNWNLPYSSHECVQSVCVCHCSARCFVEIASTMSQVYDLPCAFLLAFRSHHRLVRRGIRLQNRHRCSWPWSSLLPLFLVVPFGAWCLPIVPQHDWKKKKKTELTLRLTLTKSQELRFCRRLAVFPLNHYFFPAQCLDGRIVREKL